ncbi:FKBP-type peptidyl-prolyl cis-trans isomerase [Marinimicrobium sp. ABcell2]|uniref:FKBP-type peptidyl-prolyl cis-trans isomerase n=1 Tax=Marinimicrobium sp. ABcell2 TaxID=3069751 RepID=UPI0027ADE7E4|nr:FKBP-type peptidyl-prolyl cis-trans isomerase [Marinimicrobium sp. ABcell2]MDQ2076717.1 FKBP-type peptidyl-prolyl cis-trans isomerase [Marinimicrobium sp. ABcell2]
MSKKTLNKGSSGQNRKASQDYLSKYRQKPGVVETTTGLLYRVLEEGEGIAPALTDRVVVNQRILSVNGKVIADTYKEGEPDEFSMQEAIPGIQEGLQLGREGGRYEFVVPPELAWGKRGVGNKIGPNAVLIFDVRILEVKIG